MFSYPNLWVMVSGVLLSLTIISLALYFVYKLFAKNSQEVLVKFILLIFTSLVGVWVVDKVIAFKISLLSDGEDKELFDLIKTLILMIFSYYFGTQKIDKKNEHE